MGNGRGGGCGGGVDTAIIFFAQNRPPHGMAHERASCTLLNSGSSFVNYGSLLVVFYVFRNLFRPSPNFVINVSSSPPYDHQQALVELIQKVSTQQYPVDNLDNSLKSM